MKLRVGTLASFVDKQFYRSLLSTFFFLSKQTIEQKEVQCNRQKSYKTCKIILTLQEYLVNKKCAHLYILTSGVKCEKPHRKRPYGF